MKVKNVIEITKKEIRSFLDNPSLYIVLIVFSVLWQFLFFRSVFVVGEASLRGLFDLFPWIMLILIPAITMGSISKEKEDGTLELILTHPVNEIEIIIGKFLSISLYVIFGLLFTIPLAYSISRYGLFDWGVFAGQLLGSILFALAFISLGIYISSLFKSQIASLLITIGAGFILVISGTEFFTMSLPFVIARFFERVSIVSHYLSVSRGALDVRDVWYFLSFSFLFLYLTHLQFLKSKYGNNKAKYIMYQTAAILIVCIVFLTNIIGNRIPGRIDLTKEKIYSLSESTKNVVGNLDDIVKITFYASEQLPAQYSPIVRETRDLLRDYQISSKGNIAVEVKDPASDEELKREALSVGVQEIQFNVIGQEEFQVKTGFLGMVISYGGRSEPIPFIQDLGNLEYEITSLVKKLTNKDPKKVAFLTGYGQKGPFSDMGNFSNELAREFDISTIENTVETKTFNTDADVVIISGPTEEFPEEVISGISAFVNSGKNLFVMAERYSVSPESNQAVAVDTKVRSFLGGLGVNIMADLVYDLNSNNTIRTSNGIFSIYVPYPYWLKALAVKTENPITRKLINVDLPWASSLSLNSIVLENNGYSSTDLLRTSQFGGINVGQVTIDPNQNFPKENLSEKTVAVALEPLKNSSGGNKGKIVVVSDSEFLIDDITNQTPGNVAFGVNAVSWLADSDSLADIKAKNRISGQLVFKNESEPQTIKYISIFVVLGLPVLVGLTRYFLRRKLRSRIYER